MNAPPPGTPAGQGAFDPEARVSLRPWRPDDLPLLERLLGDPVMTRHLGGPETPLQLRARHQRYLDDRSSGLFAVVLGALPVGWVGYWERSWQDEQVWECGWSVLPEHQGRHVATAATALLVARARADGRHRYLHAFPAVANGPSNGVCRSVGFTLLGECDVEYPPGHHLRCNDWRLDLRAPG